MACTATPALPEPFTAAQPTAAPVTMASTQYILLVATITPPVNDRACRARDERRHQAEGQVERPCRVRALHLAGLLLETLGATAAHAIDLAAHDGELGAGRCAFPAHLAVVGHGALDHVQHCARNARRDHLGPGQPGEDARREW